MGIFLAAGVELGLEPWSDRLSTAEASRGAATAAASNPPVVVMKFLRLREYAVVRSMNVPRQMRSLGDQGFRLISPTVFQLPQHYTQVSVNTTVNA